jgi:hypothetical protein
VGGGWSLDSFEQRQDVTLQERHELFDDPPHLSVIDLSSVAVRKSMAKADDLGNVVDSGLKFGIIGLEPKDDFADDHEFPFDCRADELVADVIVS